jgi:hypothetical protein
LVVGGIDALIQQTLPLISDIGKAAVGIAAIGIAVVGIAACTHGKYVGRIESWSYFPYETPLADDYEFPPLASIENYR